MLGMKAGVLHIPTLHSLARQDRQSGDTGQHLSLPFRLAGSHSGGRGPVDGGHCLLLVGPLLRHL